MELEDMIIETLKNYGCSTTKQIANLIYRNYNCTVTPTSIGGKVRKYVRRGEIGTSKNEHNNSVYWMNAQRW